MTKHTLVIAPEIEPSKEVKDYLFKIIRYVTTQESELATLSRPGICQWLVDACTLTNVRVLAYRWGDMPFLANGNIIEAQILHKDSTVVDIMQDLIRPYDIIVGIHDGKDPLPNLAMAIADKMDKAVRDYSSNPTSD